MGKHLSRFFGHLFIRPEGNFYEYTLHHSLSVFLIFMSYCANMWVPGIFILILHDYSDFALILTRAYKDYRHRRQWLLTILYVHATGGWLILRVFIFFYCCVYATWYQAIYRTVILNAVEREVLIGIYYFMPFMLSCLQIMHIFWTYFIVSSFVATNVSEKIAKHSYDWSIHKKFNY